MEDVMCRFQREHDLTIAKHSQQIATLEDREGKLEAGIDELRRWIVATLATSAGSLALLVLGYLLGRK